MTDINTAALEKAQEQIEDLDDELDRVYRLNKRLNDQITALRRVAEAARQAALGNGCVGEVVVEDMDALRAALSELKTSEAPVSLATNVTKVSAGASDSHQPPKEPPEAPAELNSDPLLKVIRETHERLDAYQMYGPEGAALEAEAHLADLQTLASSMVPKSALTELIKEWRKYDGQRVGIWKAVDELRALIEKKGTP